MTPPHPTYCFADPVGPAHLWFAWFPVRLYYGKWAWLRRVSRLRHQTKLHLPGPHVEWWSYADAAP
jgi:hypothetical protein